MEFGPLVLSFDDQVLRPRPWTLAQSTWASELAASALAGPMLELCSGVGHIGLALASLVPRPIVLVDFDAHACAFARANADAAGLGDRVEIRNQRLDTALRDDERFAVVLADPPWVPSDETWQLPDDPLTAIDGGVDGLDLARACVDLIARHLLVGGTAVLQVGTEDQAATIAAYAESQPDPLHVHDVRVIDRQGALLHLGTAVERSR